MTEVMVATKVAVVLLLEVVVTFGGRRQMEVTEFDGGDGARRGDTSTVTVFDVDSVG